ncbi:MULTISPECIES: hypothetical protein [Eikenella]|uniref:Lipoprotein n=1 Tax=Eikenella exigua TaxID=2528037 RepID=A0AAX1F8B8_9NEIS|nr:MULTISPECIES: hypothetical protein [Eikenella]OAM43522.1 hypothetical protein A7Q02_00400 [Eikenella sp. NML97-A-109]QED92321.1 hypothetical protein EZJ17_06650 [Eikenella exigua]
MYTTLPPPRVKNLSRLGLIAAAVFLMAGCATLDDTMQRHVGQHISEVFREHGGRPNAGRRKVGNNRYAYTYNYYRTRYAGRQFEGRSLNGPIITSYYSDVCYGHNLYQTYYTDANDIVVDYHWESIGDRRISCNDHFN